LELGTGTPSALPMSMPATVIPEVIEPDEKLPPDLVVLRRRSPGRRSASASMPD
jgi:hypothetical protein